jgi:hypothetical protein
VLANVTAVRIGPDAKACGSASRKAASAGSRHGGDEGFDWERERTEVVEIERVAKFRIGDALAGLPVVHDAGMKIVLPIDDVVEQSGGIVAAQDVAEDEMRAAAR